MYVFMALPALHIGTAAPLEQISVRLENSSGSWADLYSSPVSEVLHRNSICAWDMELNYEPMLRKPKRLYWADSKSSNTTCTLTFGPGYSCQPVIRKIHVQRRKIIDTCHNNTVIYSKFSWNYKYLPVAWVCAKLPSHTQC